MAEFETQAHEADGINSPLTTRIRAGISWNAGSVTLVQVVAFGRAIIIARILLPEDFGLFGMALTVISALNAFTTIGLDYSIIAGKFKKKELNTHLNTVWTAELLRSIVLSLLLAASAYPTARFYSQPKLYLLIPLLSLATLIQGFRNIGLVLFRKEISFARIFWHEQATNLAVTAVTIPLVLAFRNVWALVLLHVLSAALSVFFSYVFHPYRPRLAFHKEAFQSAFKFGKFALVIAVASYVTTMADNVMVGRLLGITALGYYAIAYNLASVPIIFLARTFDSVMFPAYAELAARNSGRLADALTIVFSFGLLLLLSVTLPLFLLANDIVEMLYGSKWSRAGPVLRIVALVVPLRGAMLIVSTLFFGMNRPKPIAACKALEALVFLVILYPLTAAFGLAGAAWAGVIVYAFGVINRLVALESALPHAAAKLGRACLFAIVAGGAGVLAGGLSLTFLDLPPLRILLGGFVSVAVSATVLIILSSELRGWIVHIWGLSRQHPAVS